MAQIITPDALAAVPSDLRGQVCICPVCGSADKPQDPSIGQAGTGPLAPI